MNLDDSLNAAGRILRRRPTKVLPAFFAESALNVVAQSVLVVAAALSLLSLRNTSQLAVVLDRARSLVSSPRPTRRELEAFLDSLGTLLTPTVLLVFGVAALVVFVLGVLVHAAATAAKVHTAWAAVTDGEPTEAAVAGTVADTWAFVRFTLLQLALYVGVPAVVLLLAVSGGSAAIGGAVLLLLVYAVGLYFALLFVPEVIVSEGVGVIEAVRRNVSFVRAEPGRALLFGLLELGAGFVLGAIGTAVGALGVGRVGGLVGLLLVFPFLGLVKMGVYADPSRHPEVDAAEGRPGRGLSGGAGTGRSGPGAGDGEWSGRDPSDGNRGPGSDDGRGRPRDGRGADSPRDDRRPGQGGPRDDRRPGSGDDRRRDGPRGGRGRTDPHDDRGQWSRGQGGGPGASPGQGRGRRGQPPRGEPAPAQRPRDGPSVPPSGPVENRSAVADVRAILGRGAGELRSFLGERPGLIALSIGVFLVGIYGGFVVSKSTGIDVVSGGDGDFGFGVFPIDTAVNLAANNWQVAIGQTFAGLAFGVPALVNLAFNGVIVGGLAGLGFDLVQFAALIVPHGLLEIPALAVSGALGLHLVGVGLGLVRGDVTADEAGDQLERAFLILVGLLPVFVVAGLIEAFLTPAIGGAFG